MRTNRILKAISKRKKLVAIVFSLSLLISPLIAINHFVKTNEVEVQAADYSVSGGGFTRNSDGSVQASFTVTNNDLNMKGWMLCLFSSEPSYNSSTNKINGSNDIHPYSYSACSHYFFVPSSAKTGTISITWPANSADQKISSNWSGDSQKTSDTNNLKTCYESSSLWYIVIGPRHKGSWGGSGIGSGTDDYWENCDYYVGKSTEVFPPSTKSMSVSVSSKDVTYNGSSHSIGITVSDPSSGYSIKYRESSTGSYNLTTNPSYTNAGNYTVYFEITKSGYNTYTGSGTVKISKANPTYTAPTGISGLKYNGENQTLINAGSTSDGTIKYSLDNSSYSTDIPKKMNVGTYTIYYKLEGDSNHNNVSVQSFEVSISANDKSVLNNVINDANDYLGTISSTYPIIANQLIEAISDAEIVKNDDNQTVTQISDATNELNHAIDVAHAQIGDALIDAIGDVRYTDKCLTDIVNAENYYENSLTEDQQALVSNHDELVEKRDLYERLKAVAEVINAIGEITYDADCYERILDAKEAYETLSKDEQMLIPTLFNELNSALDIYEALKLIDDLGDVTYSEEFLEKLEEARNVFDALDVNEQKSIYNYQDLLDAEEVYNKVDEVVKLVNEIAEELEYVGTHNSDIDKAKKAFDLLDDNQKLLVPTEIKEALDEAIEEYEELKIEHERREIEDREAGVVIATEGGSGIPDTVTIDINNSQNNDENFEENINYQTIEENISEDETISSICDIKFYEEVNGEMVEVSLADIDENISVVIKLDVPEDVDDTNFKVVLLDDDNNIIEMEYTYDPVTRQVTIKTSQVGTFAIVTLNKAPAPLPASNGLVFAIIGAVLVSALIIFILFLSLRRKKDEEENQKG